MTHLVLVSSLALLLATPTAPPQATPAAFSTSVERLGEVALLRVVLENKGTKPLWVYGLLEFCARDCASRPPAAVQVALTDARGRTLRTTCQPPVAPYARNPYQVLAPGARITGSFALSSCYQMDRGEKLQVSASFQDPSESPRPPPAGAVSLPHRVDASRVTFTAP